MGHSVSEARPEHNNAQEQPNGAAMIDCYGNGQ